MKAFITACTAIAICIIISFTSQFYISDTVSLIDDAISPLDETAKQEKTPENIECLDSAINTLTSRRFALCLFINHKEFDEIEGALLSLRAAIVSADTGNYASSLAAVREKLIKLRLYEKLSIEGIL